MEVTVCCCDLFVAEPESNDGDVVAGVEETHRGCVPERVSRDVFGSERRAGSGGNTDDVSDAVFDGVAAERLACRRCEQGTDWGSRVLDEPCLDDCSDCWCERCAAFLSAFADGVHVGAGAEVDVLAGEPGEFGDS